MPLLPVLTERWAVEFESRLSNDHEQLLKSRALQSRLHDWRQRRNDVVHGLVKSSSGKYENHIDNFLEGAKESASEGKAIAREVSAWVQVFKKQNPAVSPKNSP
jgi:hypothetical protein